MDKRRFVRINNAVMLYLPIAILLVVLLTVLGTSVFLKIIVIDVTGSTKYSDSDIISVSGIALGDNILRINTEAAASGIKSAMPYIENVEIAYSLPDKVHIKIKESTFFAAINGYSGVALINSVGKVIDYVDIAPHSSIGIIGFSPSEVNVGSQLKANSDDETKLRHLLEVLAAVEASTSYMDVNFIDVTNIGRISIGYQNRYTVIIGSSSEASGKLAILPERIAQFEKHEDYNPSVRYSIDTTTDPTEGWRGNLEIN